MAPSVHPHDARSVAVSTRPTRRCCAASTSRCTPAPRSACSGSNGAGQVDAAADHGRRGRRLLRASAGVTPGFSRRVPPAGAAARPEQGRARQRHRRRRATPKGLLDRFEEVCNAMGEPDADFDKLARRAGRAAGQDRRRQRLGSRPPARDRDGRAAPAARRRRRHDALAAASAAGSRCAACCSSKPDLLLLDEPTNHLDAESVAWLERHLQEYHGTVVAVTHDRYFLDNVAGWILELDRGHGIPWEGNYSSLARAEGAAARAGGEGRRGAPPHARARARVDPHGAPRAPGQGQGAHHRVRAARRRGGSGRARARRSCRSRSRPGRASAISSSRPSSSRKGFGDRLLIDDFSFSLPPRRHRRRHRRRTAPARPRCSACSSVRNSPTAAR